MSLQYVEFSALERYGRLGNQLWQIASTCGIAASLGREGVPRFPAGWSYRAYFLVPDSYFGPMGQGISASDERFVGHLIPSRRTYLQEYGLWADIADEIREMFRPSERALRILDQHLADTNQEWIRRASAAPGSIALHVRRGDNTDPVTHQLGSWPLVTAEFYREALGRLGDGPVVVFSDDIPWCKAHLPHLLDRKDLRFVSDGPKRGRDYVPDEYLADPPLDWVDLQLMALAEHHIIANSTFSWWSAFLGNRGRVIYPDNWTGWRLEGLVEVAPMMPPGWELVHNPVAAKHLKRRRFWRRS